MKRMAKKVNPIKQYVGGARDDVIIEDAIAAVAGINACRPIWKPLPGHEPRANGAHYERMSPLYTRNAIIPSLV